MVVRGSDCESRDSLESLLLEEGRALEKRNGQMDEADALSLGDVADFLLGTPRLLHL